MTSLPGAIIKAICDAGRRGGAASGAAVSASGVRRPKRCRTANARAISRGAHHTPAKMRERVLRLLCCFLLAARLRRGRRAPVALRRVRAADQLVARPAAREAGGRSLSAGCAARRQPRHPRAAGVGSAAAARRSCERRAASAAAPAPARPEARAARRRPRRAVAQRDCCRRRATCGQSADAIDASAAIDAALVDAEQLQSLCVSSIRVENFQVRF